MNSRASFRVRFGLSALVAVGLLHGPATAAAPAGPLEGRWRLIEQRYGEGRANLVAEERPVRLVIAGGPAGASCGIAAGESAAEPEPWPAFVTDEGPAPATIAERTMDLPGGVLHARYSVRPTKSDDLVLDIEETYRVTADGNALTGEMTVRFRQAGEDRGSYTLHRRFEREP